MKFLFLFFILSVLSVSLSVAHSRGCLYISGECFKECEEGTHAYVSSCQGPTLSQKTCSEPEQRDLGGICDLSRCDCDPPTVLDEATNKCVKLEDCPKKH